MSSAVDASSSPVVASTSAAAQQVSSLSASPTTSTAAATTSSSSLSTATPAATVVAAPIATNASIAAVAAPIATPATNASIAAVAAANAKDRELCFIYSNALTKDKFNKGCIVVYKGATSSPDHSATMLEQLVAQKDIQAVKGGLQKSFVYPVDDKNSLFIAYVEVTTMPTDEQIIAMKKAISDALPKMGGKRKRFHTKKRHAKKRTTRRS